MGGLLADWQSYHDPFNDVSNPAQMVPRWFQVREMSGMPLGEQIWTVDLPASSYPACMAVKAAEHQGQAIVEDYLRRLREAVMLERRNIARQDVLLAVAQETARASSTGEYLDLKRFCDDLDAPETLEAFRHDLRDAAYYGIGRFPTLILHRTDRHGIVLVGYRPSDMFWAALEHLAPSLRRRPEMSQEDCAVAYVTYWRSVTARELAEVFGGNMAQTSLLLESLVTQGKLVLADTAQSKTPIYVPCSHR
jgi:predicted DsbA family dithiol-disulfide isomerase